MDTLKDSIRAKAFLDSSKNSGKFIPDEQILSSMKRREAKEMENASRLVPLRRRDRLEELLLLENKARFREEARLRAERRALGLPEEETEGQTMVAEAMSDDVSEQQASQTPSQRRLSSGASTPASHCSAVDDLDVVLRGIQGIVDEDPDTTTGPLTHQQVYKLRQLVHSQNKKARKLVDECPHQPHVCGHCLDVNVHARHLCSQVTGSVAYEATGKIINPEEGIKYGTHEQRGLGGTYSTKTVDPRMVTSSNTRIANYNPHPYGTGMVFQPVSSAKTSSQTAAPGTRSVRFQASFNNNIGAEEPVEEDLQYPGSTYNVYDSRATPQAAAQRTPPNADSTTGTAAKIDPLSSNKSTSQNGVNGNATHTADGMEKYTSSSAMWKTTNQDRELDMKRFLEYQAKMKANARQVYDETATRPSHAASV